MIGPSRREVLEAMSGLGAAALLPGVLAGCAAVPAAGGFEPARPGAVAEENRKPGTKDWILSGPRVDPASKWRCPWIEGWWSHASAGAGDEVSLHVSTAPASRFRVDLYRMGWYGGDGARLVAEFGSFPGAPGAEPAVGERRLRTCAWPAALRVRIPSDWPSGVYLAKLTAEREGVQSYAVLTVRDRRRADLLVQVSDTTWQAYNRWPDRYSLYDDGRSSWYWGAGVDVSFDRPYGKYNQILDQPLSTGSGEFLLWEFPLAYWLEREGYDVAYVSNLDLDEDPAGLRRAKGFLSVGHDEYYSLEMFRHLKAAIEGGLHVGFLSGNTCCGMVEFADAPDGRKRRIMRRIDRFGPRDAEGDRRFDSMKSLPRTGPNEADLVGARSTGMVVGGGDWICARPEHWLFEGTGMRAGDGVPGLVGWEWHGDPAPIPGLEIVGTGTAKSGSGRGTWTSTVYPGPRGNVVFNAATCWWADGLAAPPGYRHPAAHGAAPKGPDPRVERMTRNLLARFLA